MISEKSKVLRRLPIGAEASRKGTDFRIWAPSCEKVDVVIEKSNKDRSKNYPLKREKGGYFSGLFQGVKEGDRPTSAVFSKRFLKIKDLAFF